MIIRPVTPVAVEPLTVAVSRPDAMPAASMVFIVGVPRSGTSRLYLALQSHERFTPTQSPDRFDLTESRVFLDPASILSTRGKAWDYLLHDAEVHASLLRALPRGWSGRLPADRLFRLVTERSRWAQALAWRLCRNGAALQAYFLHAARARGVQRIVEKTPDHIHRLPLMLAAFPDARILCMIRHPLDVYSSYRRRLDVARQSEPVDSPTIRWLQSVDPQTFCRGYRATVAETCRYASRLLIVRYEDMSAAPQETFARVCTFLGEPFDPGCVTQHTPGLDTWRQDPLLSGPITENAKRWSDYLEPAIACHIEDRLEDTMRRIGYARYT
jgi:hypothetical protein